MTQISAELCLTQDFESRSRLLKTELVSVTSDTNMKGSKVTDTNWVRDFEARDRLDLAALIDSTILKPGTTLEELQKLQKEAESAHFRAICVPPIFMRDLKKSARYSRLCTVVGFPHGAQRVEVKVRETQLAVDDGADEIDFVQNPSLAAAQNWQGLAVEYKAIVNAANGALVKVIFETALLTETQIEACTRIAVQSGVHIVKTSTGFASRGASLRDIEIMSQAILSEKVICGIKASGGIRNRADALKFVKAGATRLGTSQGMALLNGSESSSTY